MLVTAIARGDWDALAGLYDRFAGTLLAVGHRILGPNREVEDLLHDVFLEVWHHAGEYSPQRGSVRSWLLVRMRSRSLDRLRSARIARAAVDEVQATTPHETQAADGPHHRALHQRLREALTTLPEDQQQVLALNYFEGFGRRDSGAAGHPGRHHQVADAAGHDPPPRPARRGPVASTAATHIVDQVDELVLGLLTPDEEAAARAHAERCLDCTAALGLAEEVYHLGALTAEPVTAAPTPALRERLVTSAAATNRFARFVDRVAEAIQLGKEKAASLLAAIDDPASWEASPWTGIRLFHLPHGPQLADAVVGFVRLPGGTRFPDYRHLGEEITLVLQGTVRDESGAINRPGDEIANTGDTAHWFEALPGPDYIYLVVVRTGGTGRTP